MRLITLKKEQNYFSKFSAFASSAAFALIFHFKLCSFSWRGSARIFLVPGRRVL